MPATVKCPTCRKETVWKNNPHRPFCSDRCRLIDLGRWAKESYRIPGEGSDFEPDDDNPNEKKPLS